ncbi:MAG: AIM24 family protein [Novosphingobium sp.]
MNERPGGFGRRAVLMEGQAAASALPPTAGFGMAQPRYGHERKAGVADDIDFQILGNDLQFVEIELDPGESVIAEPGAMVWKDFDIEPSTVLDADNRPGQGFGSKLLNAGKRMLSGESLFLAMFTNNGVGLSRRAKIAFSSPMPGNILPLRLSDYGGKVICQRESFLAAARGVSVGVTLVPGLRGEGLSGMIRGGITGMFGGEGFTMQKLEGDGWAFVHMGGAVIERQLMRGERIHVDTGCVAAYTEGVDFRVVMAGGGVRNRLLGGEGLFYGALTGPGTVWIQSVPFSRLALNIMGAAQGVGYGGETSLGRLAAVGAGVAGVAGLAGAVAGYGGGQLGEHAAEGFGLGGLSAAHGADGDGGILDTLGGWLSGD